MNDYQKEAIRYQDAICTNESKLVNPWWKNIKYMLVGIYVGILFVKTEVISWVRIQEMFHFQSFHMYGVIGTAVMVGVISVWAIKRFRMKTLDGEGITFDKKKFSRGQMYGGLIFGIGWAITGACPGPLFAQIGSGFTVVLITLLSAVFGTWVYGFFRERLPH